MPKNHRVPRPPLLLRSLGIFAVAWASWASSACASKPTMRLHHAEISGVQVGTFPPGLGVVMAIVVDVYNPNGYDVAIRAVRGQTLMAGRYTVPVDFRPPGDGVWLAAGRTTSVRVYLTLPIEMAAAVVREAAYSPTIPYRVTGRADVTASRTFQLEKDDYSLDETGEISRAQIAAVIPNTLLGHP